MPRKVPTTSIKADPRMMLGGRKSDLAYGALKRAIMLREIEPGQQIREQTVAADSQCNQSTVREALINLARDGLVNRTGYHGTHITDTSLEEAAALVRVRQSIGPRVAAQLQARGCPDLMQVHGILTAMDDTHAAGDLYQCSELDREFHAQLAIIAGMGQLAPVLQRCALHIHRFTLGSVEVPRHFFQEPGVGEEHRELPKALCEGTPQQCENAFSQHLTSVLQHWSPSPYHAVGSEQFQAQERIG